MLLTPKLKRRNSVKIEKPVAMILEKDSLLDFNYDITTQILSVRYPDLTDIPIPQIKNSLEKLYRNVVNYDIKKLLLDLRNGLRGLTESQYRDLVNEFLKHLSQTRLEKIARILPENPAREYLVEHYSQILQKDIIIQFKDQNFAGKTEALDWLME